MQFECTGALDRTLYRRVKQMTRNEMESFVQNIYNSGAEAASINKSDIQTRLETVKGLGEKRIEAILDALSDLYIDDTEEDT